MRVTSWLADFSARARHARRYGEVFKTHVLGCPCVVLATPEAARMVLVSRAHLFKPTYPPSKERMIGPQALFFHQGEYHLRVRRVVQGWLGPDALRALVPDVEAAVASTLRWWEGRETSTFHTMKRVSAGRPGPSDACAGGGLRSSSIVRLCWLPGRGVLRVQLTWCSPLAFCGFSFSSRSTSASSPSSAGGWPST